MPRYGWKPEFNLEPPPKSKGWPPPPDMPTRKVLKRSQLTQTVVPPKAPEMTADEARILYEREIYDSYTRHAAPAELLKQYRQFKDEKVSPGILRAWLMNSYEGEADEDSMPDGVGCANLGGGVRYYGSFKKGLLHGTGRLEWGNGCSFEGTFYCNRLLGRGVYSWSEGGSYTGQIYDGIPHGQGKIEGPGGFVYQGRWDHGRRHGPGRMVYGKVATHEGTWKNDRKDGDGKLVFATGSSYDGTWRDGKRHGKGKQVQRIIRSKEKSAKGAIASNALARGGRPDTVYAHCYEGEWLEGLPDGSGRSEWLWDSKSKVDSILINSYVGQYKRGMRHGKGVFYYASGALFIGNWQENMKAGLGVLIYEIGKIHFGIFSHDRYDPVSQSGFDIVEPLVSSITHLKEEDIGAAKHGILRAIMRYKTDLQDAFLFYCSLKEDNPPEKPLVKEEEDSQLTSPEAKGRKDKIDAKNEKQGKSSKKEAEDKSGSDSKRDGKEEIAEGDSKSKDKTSKKGKVEGKSDKKGNKEEESKKKKPEIEEQEPPYEPAKETIPEPESPRRGTAGRSHGISNKQFWRLLQDARILQPGIGVADVDRMLPVNQFSWDSVSDIHSPTRQLILREVILALVQIALCKFDKEEISSEEKVEKLFASAFRSLGSLKPDSWFSKVESALVRTILLENESMLQRLFLELLLESETSDYTISLGSLIKYGQDRRPQHDVPPGALLELVLKELYYYQMKPEDNIFVSLYHNINYKEFEIILLIFSTLGEDVQGVGDEDAGLQLAELLKRFLAGTAGKSSTGDKNKKTKGAKVEPKNEKTRK
ncbi:hypothetical protein R1sor_007484 [Riccia sorocarpa]|uniref:Uncharacterized protein n=1 Tax=Riccia sorocarpa TaxID=122646 RepID=A0ABD3HQW8_9MARC